MLFKSARIVRTISTLVLTWLALFEVILFSASFYFLLDSILSFVPLSLMKVLALEKEYLFFSLFLELSIL